MIEDEVDPNLSLNNDIETGQKLSSQSRYLEDLKLNYQMSQEEKKEFAEK